MKEIQSNLWDLNEAHWLCITTNGILRKNGSATMGMGIAREARDRVPGLDIKLGKKLKQYGHVFQYIDHEYRMGQGRLLFSFPTKNDWRVPSPLWLIARSCEQLRDAWESTGRQYNVALVRPGCGQGERNYSKEVRPILDRYFGDTDKIWIVTY